MYCHKCHQLIGNKERYVKFRVAGITPQLYFHDRRVDDCWTQYVKANPTIRIMEVTEGGLVEHKTEYYS